MKLVLEGKVGKEILVSSRLGFLEKFSANNFALSEHVYMRPEVNSNQCEISNRFEMLFRLHGNLHRDFTAATFQTIARLYCTCASDIF